MLSSFPHDVLTISIAFPNDRSRDGTGQKNLILARKGEEENGIEKGEREERGGKPGMIRNTAEDSKQSRASVVVCVHLLVPVGILSDSRAKEQQPPPSHPTRRNPVDETSLGVERKKRDQSKQKRRLREADGKGARERGRRGVVWEMFCETTKVCVRDDKCWLLVYLYDTSQHRGVHDRRFRDSKVGSADISFFFSSKKLPKGGEVNKCVAVGRG